MVLGGVLVGGLLIAAPAQADTPEESGATSKLSDVKLPGKPGNANSSDGGASALSRASEKAKATKEPVTVSTLSTPTEEFIANPDGTVTRETAQSPVRVQKSGKWVDIDSSLGRSGDRLAPKAMAGKVSFSGDGDAALAVASFGEATVGLSLPEMDLQEPKVDGPVATYGTDPAGDTAGESVRVAAKSEGFAAHVLLGQAPDDAPTYVFDLDLDGLKPSLKDGVLSLADAGGEVVAESRPLRMWDAQVDEAGDPDNIEDVEASLEQTESGWQLTLTPSMDFLAAETTEYPVTVDPDIARVKTRGDVFFRNGADANKNFSGEPSVRVGRFDGQLTRGFLSFEYNPYLGATVTDAQLSLYQYYAPSCTSRLVRMHSMTGGDRLNATWNTQPSHTTDSRFSASKSFSRGSAGCSRGSESIDVTNIVNGWAGAHVGTHTGPTGEAAVVNHRQAFIARAANESSDLSYKRFCSEHWSSDLNYCNTASRIPRLSVTFEPEIGEQSWYSMTERSLDDRTTVKVNNKNANLFVQSNDVNIKGVGTDLSISRMYNSQAVDVGPMGRSWLMNVGPDVWLEKKSEYRYDFHTPGGTILGSFVRGSTDPAKAAYNDFNAPLGGVGSELEQTDDGFTLTLRKSQTKYVFDKTNSGGDAFMTKMVDRSDNEIAIAYSGTAGTKPKISSITDTVDRVLTPTYTGNVITKWATANVAGVGVRQWNYSYDGQYLSSASDALGKTTNYAYTAAVSGIRLLSSMTAPANESGQRPSTEFSYATNDGQLATAGYRFANGTNDLYTFSWDLNSSRVAACDGNGDLSTVVTDARSNDTTYCYDARDSLASDAKTWVYDALGNARSQDYNSDNQPTSGTSATGQGVAGGSTVAAYNDNISDQLSSVTAPRSSGSSQGESSAMTYGKGSELPGGDYLPLSVKDGAGDCNQYGYDNKGRTTTTFSGITANSAGGCGTTKGEREFHRDFNNNGTLDMSWDANAGNEPADADKTAYTYWATGDTGYVPGSKGQVKTIRKPGGNCTTAADRALCTSYTYDGAGRVLTVTDGRGTVTTYQYDKNDRNTTVLFDSATGCAATFANCVQYTYDAAGNLTQRSEEAGQSTFEYDRLNRQTGQNTPGASPLTPDSVEYTYDAVGNMTGYSQAFNSTNPDVTTYVYDKANRPTEVTSATGTFELDVNKDGRTTGVNFPNPNNEAGLKLSYDYTTAGKPTEFEWSEGDDTRVGTWTYDYTAGSKDTSQMQARTYDAADDGDQNGTSQYSYDEQRLTGVQNSSTAGADYAYSYDNVGNVLSEKAGADTTHYGYDKAGQRCWQGTTTGSAAQKLSRTCANGPSGSTNFTHDDAGNNTGTATDPVEYNKQSQVDQIGGTDQDYLDQGNDLRHTRDGQRQLSGSMGISATTSTTETVYYTRDPSGNILAGRTSNSTWFYVTEPNGDVAALTDVAGVYLGSYEYSPYGSTTVLEDADFNPLRWLGSWQEDATSNGNDIYKLGARYYTTNGAFTQPDAIAGNLNDPRTLTAYNYAGGDPTNNADPTGYFLDDVADGLGSFFNSTGGELFNFASACFGGGAALAPLGAAVGTAFFTPGTGTAGGGLLAATAGCVGGVLSYGIFGDNVVRSS